MFLVLFTYSFYIQGVVISACPIHLAYIYRYHQSTRQWRFSFYVLMRIYLHNLFLFLLPLSETCAIHFQINQKHNSTITLAEYNYIDINRRRPYYSYQYPIYLFFCTMPFRNDIREPRTQNKYIHTTTTTKQSYNGKF